MPLIPCAHTSILFQKDRTEVEFCEAAQHLDCYPGVKERSGALPRRPCPCAGREHWVIPKIRPLFTVTLLTPAKIELCLN